MRTIVLIDGQNLFHLAKEAWGHSWPNYDVQKLAQALTALKSGRVLEEVRFYTGMPTEQSNPRWYGFWNNKLRRLERQGIRVYRGRISYGQEKGVDVSLALDLVSATYEQRYDTSIIVSQDSDFGPAVRIAKGIARDQGRNLVFESAFPFNPLLGNRRRGVPGTDWIPIYQALYDACLDPTNYFPRRQ